MRCRTFALTALWAALGPALPAQSAFDATVRAGPQFVLYRIASPVNETISEFTVPIFVVLPVNSRLTFDIGSAYAWARTQPNGGGGQQSTIHGLTDTQLRARMTFGSDALVLTAGLNIPTGRETATQDEQLAAYRIGSDFLSFPISNLGTGFGVTGGVAVATPLGPWNIGIGASVRRSSSYKPFEDTAGGRPRFQPGNEYRARVGVDRSFGTGRLALGVSFAKFGDDDIAGSIYNTGDRYTLQGGFTNDVGGADVMLSAWNLYRTAGTIFTGTRVGPENITGVVFGIGVHTIGGVLEPALELRTWQQEDASTSVLGTLGARYSVIANGWTVTPSAGYTLGRFATPGRTTAMTGLRAALAIRWGS